ncbi:MAG: alpha/beta hydrolase [Clostridia bacterium]|nr:alpha/beta hydrolase [Clostridia bacterium]
MIHKIIEISEKTSKYGFTPKLTTYLLDTVESDIDRPAVIVFPGGAYAGRSYREGERIAIAYNSAGFHSFVLDYSVAPHRYPQSLLDAANAIRYVRKHAEEWKIDKNKIVVVGFSAGGHLAASISTLWDSENVFAKEEIASGLHKPNACILAYPVITSGEKAHRGSFNNLLGENATEEMLKFLSLENRVTEKTAPTFLWHTYEDEVVPVENSLLYATALSKHRVPCEMHIYPKGHHGLSRASDETLWSIPIFPRKYDWLEQSCEWIIDLFCLQKLYKN